MMQLSSPTRLTPRTPLLRRAIDPFVREWLDEIRQALGQRFAATE
jgi:hypothetical protein